MATTWIRYRKYVRGFTAPYPVARRKAFFSEEKKQKTFDFWLRHDWCFAPNLPHAQDIKVFWFFFSKKNAFLSDGLNNLCSAAADRGKPAGLPTLMTLTPQPIDLAPLGTGLGGDAAQEALACLLGWRTPAIARKQAT